MLTVFIYFCASSLTDKLNKEDFFDGRGLAVHLGQKLSI